MNKSKIVDGICPFCNNKKFTRISQSEISNVKCTKCGAIFYHPSILDEDIAGTFTGQYGSVDKDMERYGFFTKQDDEEK